MKKIGRLIGLIICCALLVATCASAASNKGGFVGSSKGGKSNMKVVTVAEAKKMKDDADVILVGRITKQLGHEKYTFKDDSGSITVEIDDDDWRGVKVDTNDRVRIYGEVEREKLKTEIEVKKIELVDNDRNNRNSKKK